MSAPLPPSGSPVCVMMAVRNGEAFLPAQLHSIALQEAADWRLLVSDDGSTDGTAAVLQEFAAAQAGRVALIDGPGRGATENFRHLIAHAPQGQALAFADQDDIWLPAKLRRALAKLEGAGEPALYGGRVMIADREARPLRPGRLPARPASFRNALVQNVFPGNTIVMNAAAAALLQEAEARVRASGADYVLHDWWTYLLVAGAGGRLIFDDWPGVLYRQHGSNVVGENAGLRASLARMRAVLAGRNAGWTDRHLAALAAVADLLTPEARQAIAQLHGLRAMRNPLRRAAGFRRSGIYAQSRRAQLGLWLAVLLGRL